MTAMAATAWSALGGDPSALDRLEIGPGTDGLPSPLPVGRLAAAAVSCVGLAVSDTALVRIDPARVATAYTSDRHLRIDGRSVDPWAPLSGFWPTDDGWVRTHANYSHHRQRLLTALSLPDDTNPDALAARVGALTSLQVEDLVTAAGGIAVALRTEREWEQHPVATEQALISRIRVADGARRPVRTLPGLGSSRPLSGVKVLDLTRVIAGPVAARTLGLLGAQVLRIDSPDLPEIGWQHLDTGMDKRSTQLDLRIAGDRSVFNRLLAQADVLITGYRPGALEKFALGSGLPAHRPGLVTARLSAWGSKGPWSGRRGFDSIVQAATGISWIESIDARRPGALPAQALDHSAGYLMAAAIIMSVREQQQDPDPIHIETSLLAMSECLRSEPRQRRESAQCDPGAHLAERSGLRYALPAVQFAGGPDDYREVGRPWGVDTPTWNWLF